MLNNNSHDSVGGQNTFSDDINFKNFSKSLGFKNFTLIDNKKNLRQKIKNFLSSKDLSFLEVKVSNSKMKTIQDQANFHKCWILYYNSVSFVDIFEYTNNLNAWDNPEDLVTTKIKRWAVIYNWKRRNC